MNKVIITFVQSFTCRGKVRVCMNSAVVNDWVLIHILWVWAVPTSPAPPPPLPPPP